MKNDTLEFIKSCIQQRKIVWTRHVNMRLEGRFISRESLLSSVDSYEIIEKYPMDKYLPSYLIYAKLGDEVFHIHFACGSRRRERSNHYSLSTDIGKMGRGLQETEGEMKCHDCGAVLRQAVTDLPFKKRANSIIILKKLPVLQCDNCSQFFIEDATMARVDELLKGIDRSAELEILSYALSPGQTAEA